MLTIAVGWLMLGATVYLRLPQGPASLGEVDYDAARRLAGFSWNLLGKGVVLLAEVLAGGDAAGVWWLAVALLAANMALLVMILLTIVEDVVAALACCLAFALHPQSATVLAVASNLPVLLATGLVQGCVLCLVLMRRTTHLQGYGGLAVILAVLAVLAHPLGLVVILAYPLTSYSFFETAMLYASPVMLLCIVFLVLAAVSLGMLFEQHHDIRLVWAALDLMGDWAQQLCAGPIYITEHLLRYLTGFHAEWILFNGWMDREFWAPVAVTVFGLLLLEAFIVSAFRPYGEVLRYGSTSLLAFPIVTVLMGKELTVDHGWWFLLLPGWCLLCGTVVVVAAKRFRSVLDSTAVIILVSVAVPVLVCWFVRPEMSLPSNLTLRKVTLTTGLGIPVSTQIQVELPAINGVKPGRGDILAFRFRNERVELLYQGERMVGRRVWALPSFGLRRPAEPVEP